MAIILSITLARRLFAQVFKQTMVEDCGVKVARGERGRASG